MWWIPAALANPYAQTSPIVAAPFSWDVPAIHGEGDMQLVLTVPAGHAVYRDALEVEVVAGNAGVPRFPEPEFGPDPSNPGSFRALYRNTVVVTLPVRAGDLELALSTQGCRAGLCWPRETVKAKVVIR